MRSGGNFCAKVLLAGATGTQKTRRSRRKFMMPDIHGRPVDPDI
jgi:hypothetical protein